MGQQLSQQELSVIRTAFNSAAAHDQDTLGASEVLGFIFRKVTNMNGSPNQINQLTEENEKLKAQVAETYAENESLRQERDDVVKQLMAAKANAKEPSNGNTSN